MKAGIIVTGTGPILILTACESLDDPRLVRQLNNKGITKYIAYEVPIEKVKERYGQHFGVTLGDLKQRDDLRIMDEEGHHVFYNFSLNELGEPIYHEEVGLKMAA